MIERVFVQENNVSIPAFMIGVATDTVLTVNVGDPAVIAPSLLDIAGDLLVTAQTEITLLNAVEDRMTLTTVILKLGMPFDDRTWHDQPFDGLAQRRSGETRQQDEGQGGTDHSCKRVRQPFVDHEETCPNKHGRQKHAR